MRYPTQTVYYSLYSAIARVIKSNFGIENGKPIHESGYVVKHIFHESTDNLDIKGDEVAVLISSDVAVFAQPCNRTRVVVDIRLSIVSDSDKSADFISLSLLDLFDCFEVEEKKMINRELKTVGERTWSGKDMQLISVTTPDTAHRVVSFTVEIYSTADENVKFIQMFESSINIK